MPKTSDFLLEDGFGAIITVDGVTDLKFEEIESKPAGYGGDGAINVTTHRQTVKLHAQAPKKVSAVTPISCKVAYKTSVEPVIRSLLKVNKLVTFTYPDGATLAIYCWLDKFEPDGNKIGDRPTADVEFLPSLRHPTTGVITAPVYTPGPDIT